MALVGGFWACTAGETSQQNRTSDAGTSMNEPPIVPPGDDRGAVWFNMMCASCHGNFAEGGSAVALNRWDRGRAELVAIIDERMPYGNPTRCQGECPEAIADYILADLQLIPPTCEDIPLPQRQLRLLTRREMLNSLQDIFAAVPARTCSQLSECNYAQESCTNGQCIADPCALKTFVYDPGRAANAIVIAGSFNNWGATAAAGGWPLSYDAGLRRWVGKHQVPNGRHAYKYVIDGQDWRPDPTNPLGEPDGFGGQNSLLEVTCGPQTPATGLDLAAWVAQLPNESRPQHYFFDNSASAGLMTADHITEYLAIAQNLATALARPSLVNCNPSDKPACARALAESYGKKLYRRPLTAEETQRLVALVSAEPELTDGLAVALRVLLTAPQFLYRSELGALNADGTYHLTGWEIASALSYFFLATTPDDTLLAAAERGELDTQSGVEAQARRLLADPRAREVAADFAEQWLGIGGILTKPKMESLYPQFDNATRRALLDETRTFYTHVVFDGSHQYQELLTARYGFMNQASAWIYGEEVSGDNLRRVNYSSPQRAGILSHASVLASYAYSDQSSPPRRGVFVRERILCQEFGIPPPNAGTLPDIDPNATTRDRFAQHSSDPACAGCHRYIDPVGFGFERYDAIGAYRERENGQVIDPSGDMNDVEGFGTGTRAPFTTLAELAQVVAASSRAKNCFAAQLHHFARGDLAPDAEVCAVEDFQRRFAAVGYDIRELMIAVTQAPGFARRRE